MTREAEGLSLVARRAADAVRERRLATGESPVLLMVSGGSDSTALAYVACELRAAGLVGPLAMLHVNHQLRGADADADARFVAGLAELLDIPLFLCEIDVAAEAKRTGGNVEAVARRERYLAANEALRSLCQHEAAPIADGRIFTAHTADDRVESFYMRSIVGTGPGGFRSMRYANGPVARPLMDTSREELRAYVEKRERSGKPVACDAEGGLWREDATNAHTDRFRAYVRHEIVPRAKERNPQLLDVLGRTMNLIADEDDFMESLAEDVADRCVAWLAGDGAQGTGLRRRLRPSPLVRGGASAAAPPRVPARPAEHAGPGRPRRDGVGRCRLDRLLRGSGRAGRARKPRLRRSLPPQAGRARRACGGARACKAAGGKPLGGYVANIQGDLAVSANKRGVRVEPMAAFRARRKRA